MDSQTIDLTTASGEAQIEEPIDLHVGDTLNIIVKENKSTGFTWKWNEEEDSIFSVEKHEEEPVNKKGN